MATEEEKNVLMHGAFADLLHDFSAIATKTTVSKNKDFVVDFNEGLPNSKEIADILGNNNNLNDLLDSEEGFFQRIFEEVGDSFIPDTSFDHGFPNFQIGKNKEKDDYYAILQNIVNLKIGSVIPTVNTTVTIYPEPDIPVITTKTFNEHEYVIKSRVIIAKKNTLIARIVGDKYDYHSPYQILEQLGIKDHSAFVVDFASISLPDFLTAPNDPLKPVGLLKNLYFITNPETENDAAGKTSSTSACYFKDFNNGIKIHSLQQSNNATSSIYGWADKTAYGQFFTSYTFALSGLITVPGSNHSKLKTDLIISNPADPNMIENIADSGNASNITFVKNSIFNRIKTRKYRNIKRTVRSTSQYN